MLIAALLSLGHQGHYLKFQNMDALLCFGSLGPQQCHLSQQGSPLSLLSAQVDLQLGSPAWDCEIRVRPSISEPSSTCLVAMTVTVRASFTWLEAAI